MDYQNMAYAETYLDRLRPFREADPGLCSEVARHLAVRMSYEDIIRVAQAKTRPGRLARIRAETGAAPGEKVQVTEFFKPGFAEFRDILPVFLARRLVSLAGRCPALSRLQWSMHLRSTSVSGYLRLRLLAALRRWRRGTWRTREESRAIEDWLALIGRAAQTDPALAVEIAECAGLIRGYGDTHRRGLDRYAHLREAVIEPAIKAGGGADRVASARRAALADIDDDKFQAALDRARPQAAVPQAISGETA
jgi:indolepyruvate ferredoxin oxidoreductase beta subunit